MLGNGRAGGPHLHPGKLGFCRDTGPYPLENHKATQLALNGVPYK